MGYLYSKMSPFYNTRTISISTAGTNMFPTSTGVVYDNNAFDNLPGDEKHYLISETELEQLAIDVAEGSIGIYGRTQATFFKRKKEKKWDHKKNLGHVYFFKIIFCISLSLEINQSDLLSFCIVTDKIKLTSNIFDRVTHHIFNTHRFKVSEKF